MVLLDNRLKKKKSAIVAHELYIFFFVTPAWLFSTGVVIGCQIERFIFIKGRSSENHTRDYLIDLVLY